MSALPGATTKQMRVAPALSMRSTRNSLTARGRSMSPASVLPTGSSSLEKPSGWIRVPRPAAGTMPHMVCYSLVSLCHSRRRRTRVLEQLLELARAMGRRVLREHALVRRARDPVHFGVGQLERVDDVLRRARHDDLLARPEELLQPGPRVADHGRAAGRRLEEPPRRAVAVHRHRAARHVERPARGGKKARMLR